MRMMRVKAYWTVAGEERGAVIAPKDEVEDDEARHAIPQQGRERKHQPRCHIKIFAPSRSSTHAHARVIRIENRWPRQVLEGPNK